MEGILLDTMFDLPSLEGVEEVVISREVVEGTARPLYIYADRADRATPAPPAPERGMTPPASIRAIRQRVRSGRSSAAICLNFQAYLTLRPARRHLIRAR